MDGCITVNRIDVWHPKWNGRAVYIADWKIGQENEIHIDHHNYPLPFLATGAYLRSFPIKQVKTKAGGLANMRRVPLTELSTAPIWAQQAKRAVEAMDARRAKLELKIGVSELI